MINTYDGSLFLLQNYGNPKEGVRDLVMELCCALHNFRVRLNPWLPMI